jgi:NitT/TauT family transport system substrate-binding protein
MLRPLALAATLVALALMPASRAQAPAKLRAAYLKSLSFSPLFLAQEKGYLAAEGLDVDLQIVQSASEVVAFMARGQMDAAFGNIGVPLFNAAARQMEVKIVGGVSYYPQDPAALSPCPILIRKDLTGTLKDVRDLKGRKVAFNTRGGVIEYLAVESLKRHGLSLKDIDVVEMPFPDMAAALANGAVDAALIPEPGATAAVSRGIATVLDVNPAPGTLATVLSFGANLLSPQGSKTAAAFLRGLRRAAADLQSPQAVLSPEHVAIWAKTTEIPASLIARTAPYVFDKDLAIDVADLKKQAAYAATTGQIAAVPPVEALIDGTLAATR